MLLIEDALLSLLQKQVKVRMNLMIGGKLSSDVDMFVDLWYWLSQLPMQSMFILSRFSMQMMFDMRGKQLLNTSFPRGMR